MATARGHQVVGIVGCYPHPVPGLVRQLAIDLAQVDRVRDAIRETRADVIVNAAAISDLGECIAAPALARQLNVELPFALATEARKAGAVFLHLSTDQVFPGTDAPYAVGDCRQALNLYARLKMEAEDRVLAAAATHAIVLRLPPLMGNSLREKRSLHERMLMSWSGGQAVKLFTDEIRQCCSVGNLVRAMLEMAASNGLRGPLHWAGAEALSRFAIGSRIRAHFDLTEDAAPIIGISRVEEPAIAASRPANLALDLTPLESMLFTKPQTFAEALTELALPSWARRLDAGGSRAVTAAR